MPSPTHTTVSFTFLALELLRVVHLHLKILSEELKMRENMWHLPLESVFPHSTGTLKFHLFTWQFHNLFFFVTAEQYSMASVELLFLLMQGSGEETKNRWRIGRLFCYLPPACMCLDGRVQQIELNFVQVVPDKAAGAWSMDSFLLMQLAS